MNQHPFSQLHDLEGSPPPGIWDAVSKAITPQAAMAGADAFGRLYHAQPEPPAFIWDKISAAIAPVPVKPAPVRGISNRNLWYGLVAACVAGLGIWLFSNLASNTHQSGHENDLVNGSGPVKKDTGTIRSGDTLPTMPRQATGDIAQQDRPDRPVIQKHNRPVVADAAILDIDIEEDAFFNNTDLFHRTADIFSATTSKKVLIKTGDGEVIRISDKMAAFLRRLYSRNKRNRPTKDARKAFRTLKRWNRDLRRNFDGDTPGNALDPVTLHHYLENQ